MTSPGFTLIEALVAMTLSAVLITLATSVFLVQHRLYENVAARSQVQESARSVAELVSSELRPASRGAVTLAESQRLAVRTPQAVGMICGVSSGAVQVFLPLSGEGVVTSEVTGYGIRESNGVWSFYPKAWSELYVSSGSSTSRSTCADQGADTANAAPADFFQLSGPDNEPSPVPVVGDLLMIYREVEYSIASSGLEDGALGLFRGLTGETPVEFATGISADAGFQYRLEGQTSFQSPVTGSDLADIVSVRLVSVATETQSSSGGEDPYSYGFTVDIPLRNVQ